MKMSKKTQIKKVLIANRGEIAIRVIKTSREMGIKTVTIYTEVEKELPHAYAGDENISLGSGTLAETYLNQELLLKIAKDTGADAIHPGYGFLSENAEFSRLVTSNNIIFIGPSPESMILMGDKTGSKKKMEELGIPLIPGYHGDNQDSSFLEKESEKIGYPLLVKASAGGGGKGMRIVRSKDEFMEGLESAKREAKNAFGDDRVLLEKYIENPRHIEIQVFSDSHDQHFHLFERECSIQRRHQKIVEESPSPVLTSETRQKMTDVSKQITKGIDYHGAGTIEYIYDEDQKGAFYFLEMNTRLQVEHPVTEMVTGLDLVRMQILAAQGEKINLQQDEIQQRGHAIEVRLYGEDPDNSFLPSVGKISKVGHPTVNGARLDTGYVDGNEVTIHFDPMLAKLIVYGVDREQAIAKMQLALNQVPFLGVKTNREYLQRILKSQPFKDGDTLTHFVDKYADILIPQDLSEEEQSLAIASYLLKSSGSSEGNKVTQTEAWQNISGFRNI